MARIMDCFLQLPGITLRSKFGRLGVVSKAWTDLVAQHFEVQVAYRDYGPEIQQAVDYYMHTKDWPVTLRAVAEDRWEQTFLLFRRSMWNAEHNLGSFTFENPNHDYKCIVRTVMYKNNMARVPELPAPLANPHGGITRPWGPIERA